MRDDKASAGGLRRHRLALICLLSALALAAVLGSVLLSDCSSADGDARYWVDLEGDDGKPLTVPIIDNTYFSFDTATRPDGLYYELDTGVPIDSNPAYFAVRAEQGADRCLYRVSVGMEGMSGTWMDYYGIRVITDDGCYADLRKDNNYASPLYKDGELASLESGVRHRISLVTLGGSQRDMVPGPIGNIRIYVEAEPVPGYHEIEFVSLGVVIESKILFETEELGPLPVPVRSGFFFEGWYDSDGNRVNALTTVSELSSDRLDARWSENPDEWPKITHTVETVVNPDGSVTVIDTTLIEQSDGSYQRVVVETTTYPDGSTEEERIEEDVDPDGEMDRTSSKTVITDHDDGSRTLDTDIVTERKDGSSDVSKVVTEFDSDSNMVYEWTDFVRTDTVGESREYIVTAEVVDTREMKYRVEAILPDTTILDVDNAKELIDRYDYTVAVVGTHSDTGLLIVPEDTMQVVAQYGYYISASNDEQYVALDDVSVRALSEAGGEVRLRIERATDEKMTPTQIETVGDAYAVSVELTVDGKPVRQLAGMAEVIVLPGYDSANVYRVNEDGSTVKCDSEYDRTTGKVYFSVDHLSIFMVEQTNADDGYPSKEFTFGFTCVWLLFVIAIFLFLVKKKKRRETVG